MPDGEMEIEKFPALVNAHSRLHASGIQQPFDSAAGPLWRNVTQGGWLFLTLGPSRVESRMLGLDPCCIFDRHGC